MDNLDCRGQGYVGAGAVAGKDKGLQAQIRRVSPKADSLFQLVTDFSFIATLIITKNISDYLLSVTRKHQTKDSEIAQSTDLIKSVKLTIEKLKNNSLSLSHYAVWYCRGAGIQTWYGGT